LNALIKLHVPLTESQSRLGPSALSVTIEEIVQGLANESSSLSFQPKVLLANRSIKGAEALARWRHPQKGNYRSLPFIGLL